MHARSIDGHPALIRAVAAALRAVVRAALQILSLAVVSAVVLSVRYLIFEYNHGDREMVLRLIDKLSP